MKLLQNSWSDMLVLDHIHQRLHNGLPDETTLHNGQKFDLLGLGLLGVPSLAEHFNELQNKLQELKFDVGDYICMKFLLLLNPGKERLPEAPGWIYPGFVEVCVEMASYAFRDDFWGGRAIMVVLQIDFAFSLSTVEVRGITNRKTVVEGYENVQAALLDYTLTCYPSVPVSIRCVRIRVGHIMIKLTHFPPFANRISLVSCSVLFRKSTRWPPVARSTCTLSTVPAARLPRRY